MMLILALGAGGQLLRVATKKRIIWWHGVLFYALYLGCAHLLFWLINFFWPALDSFERAFVTTPNKEGFELVLALLFPLGAPIAEIAFNSFKRAHKTNETGSLI